MIGDLLNLELLLRGPAEYWTRLRRATRPMRRDYRRRLSMTLRDWLLYHQREIAFKKCHWMGVKAIKNPLDAWIYQEILHEVRPDAVIEIGSAEGGTTLFLADIMERLGAGTVVSVDIDRSAFRATHPRILSVTGDSSGPETVREVARVCAGKSVLVIHDGGHTREQVERDLEAYAPLVSVGSYLIVEDGVIDLFSPGDGIGTYEDGPLTAVEAFLSRHPEYVVDSERERYLLTYNPMGFLKRIR